MDHPDVIALLSRVLAAVPDATPVYLVGGAARDFLINRSLHDLDFVVMGNALKTARQVADRLGGAYYAMDVEHATARVVLTEPGQPRLVLDFAAGRGETLEADLRNRDFTINAIAVDPHDPDRIIDPLGGAVDLHARRLRVCSEHSFQDDPNRILRALRLATAFKLQIEPETRRLLRAALPKLPEVSAERIRDEVFRMLEGKQPATAIRSMEVMGVLPYIFPELPALKGITQSAPHVYDVWEHTLSVVGRLEELLSNLGPMYSEDGAGSLVAGLAVMRLGRYRQQFTAHLAQQFNPDRTRRGILFFAALYHDVAKPISRSIEEGEHGERIRFFGHDEKGALIAAQRASALHLSNEEVETVRSIVRHHMRPFLISEHGEKQPSRRAIYRFFRASGGAGVEICLHSMADFWGTRGAGMRQEAWSAHLGVVRTLLEAYWEQPEQVVSPPGLLTGSDLIQKFHLKPGRVIGELLEAVREAQVEGIVADQESALEFVRNILKD